MPKRKKSYQWYRHHAWAGLALVSILFIIRGMVGIPAGVFYPVVIALLIYAVTFLVLTYRQASELVKSPSMDKASAKAAKKQTKAELKRQKKKDK